MCFWICPASALSNLETTASKKDIVHTSHSHNQILPSLFSVGIGWPEGRIANIQPLLRNAEAMPLMEICTPRRTRSLTSSLRPRAVCSR